MWQMSSTFSSDADMDIEGDGGTGDSLGEGEEALELRTMTPTNARRLRGSDRNECLTILRSW